MSPSSDLIDSIYREKVLRARGMTVGERLDAGIELFEASLNWMRTGIAHQFPGSSPEQVEQQVKRRLDIARKLDEHGIYRTATELAN